MVTNKILVLFLLSIALPTICMDVGPEDVAPEVQRLDDGQEWLSIKNLTHLVPLLKKVVACRSEALDQSDRVLYKIDASNPTRYGFITDQSLWAKNYDLRLLCIDSQVRLWHLANWSLRSNHSFMRLLTYDEMRRMNVDAASGALQFYQMCDFTLDNLTPQERIKYFRAQAGKQSWPWQRLVLLGHKDHGSPLHLLPKDIIRTLGRYTLHAQAYELLDRAKLEDVLNL